MFADTSTATAASEDVKKKAEAYKLQGWCQATYFFTFMASRSISDALMCDDHYRTECCRDDLYHIISVSGNTNLKMNKFHEAVSCYSKAVELDSTNATYFCNRLVLACTFIY